MSTITDAAGLAPAARVRHLLSVALALIFLIAVLAAAGALVWLNRGGDRTAAFRARLTSDVTPLIDANTTLSVALGSISGADPRGAKAAVRDAEHTLRLARQAIEPLSAPSADALLAQQTEQALIAEDGYLQAVAAALARPAPETIAVLRVASVAVASALVPLDPVAPGAHASLASTGPLIEWAGRQVQAAGARAARQRAAADQRAVDRAAASAAGAATAQASALLAGEAKALAAAEKLLAERAAVPAAPAAPAVPAAPAGPPQTPRK